MTWCNPNPDASIWIFVLSTICQKYSGKLVIAISYVFNFSNFTSGIVITDYNYSYKWTFGHISAKLFMPLFNCYLSYVSSYCILGSSISETTSGSSSTSSSVGGGSTTLGSGSINMMVPPPISEEMEQMPDSASALAVACANGKYIIWRVRVFENWVRYCRVFLKIILVNFNHNLW